MTADRRVRRTRSALLEALMSLMAARGYRGISVDALLERAKVARSTFYAHFRGKDDLLRENVKHLRALAVDQAASPEQKLLQFSRAFFTHAGENRALYLSLLRDPDRGGAVFKRMQVVLAEVATRELDTMGCDADAREPTVQFFVGAQWSVMAWWLERRPSLDAAAAHERFERLVLPVLATLRA
jgi:AcrR family transcriptional regulator